ncbi:hypothetical protein SK803_35795 [Lentzea sp. BCCO 10_0856]|uniref:Uncharacterized protein n=1 Tax=Lentzea miocenica TaxID=3095431 RepID=A0ABU4TBN9_9PSEU|nr:hypothetical protein [Lentzea sp. BCCO 10_0856]MDX8035597.1 hypothetical protein [Lentzea sp. BCCO 10_0856]
MGVLTRVLRELGGEEALDRLARLSGSDLTSVLLALMRRRAGALSGPDVLRQYRSDRFVAPAEVPFAVLRAAEDRLLAALPSSFSVLGLAPVAPLGTCSAVAEQNQNNVLSTVRGTEVAADPTNALALEAAVRRQSGPDDVRLAAVQRVVRAQLFGGAGRFAHFTLFAAVSAGRDRGSLSFERQHFAEHIAFLREACGDIEVRVTVLDPRFEVVRGELPADPSRHTGYYEGLCFKVFRGGVEIGDGGFVDWTQRLTGNRKERLLISGVGVDRFATC